MYHSCLTQQINFMRVCSQQFHLYVSKYLLLKLGTPKSILEQLKHMDRLLKQPRRQIGEQQSEVFVPGTICAFLDVAELCSSLYLDSFTGGEDLDPVSSSKRRQFKFIVTNSL